MKTENTQVNNIPAVSELDSKITQWKAQYGKLYKSIIDGEIYIWRKLKRKEYTDLMTDRADDDQISGRIYERQEKIATAVVLFPENIDELIAQNAGLATTIADEVILRSGFELASTEEL